MFDIEVTETAWDDLRFFKKREQNVIMDAVAEQLAAEPLVETTNRKALRPNTLADRELRVGSYRVFYDVDETAKTVTVIAIGWKEHNKLYIRGKERVF